MTGIEPGSYITSRSFEEIKKEKEILERAAKRMLSTPGAGSAFLLKHGFITKDGKLGRAYR